MKYFDKQIIRLFVQLTFNTCYIQNVVWNHRNVSFVFQMCQHICSFLIDLQIQMRDYRSCSRLFVSDASDFVSSIRYLFILIFSRNNAFDQDLEPLFSKVNLRYFRLDLLYHSGTHYTLADSNQNRCMYFLVAKEPCELAVKLSEVWIRILVNNIVSISNDFLINGEYGLSRRKEKRVLFLDSCVQFLKSFYSVACKLVKANAFVFMYEKIEPNVETKHFEDC